MINNITIFYCLVRRIHTHTHRQCVYIHLKRCSGPYTSELSSFRSALFCFTICLREADQFVITTKHEYLVNSDLIPTYFYFFCYYYTSAVFITQTKNSVLNQYLIFHIFFFGSNLVRIFKCIIGLTS